MIQNIIYWDKIGEKLKLFKRIEVVKRTNYQTREKRREEIRKGRGKDRIWIKEGKGKDRIWIKEGKGEG